MRQYLKTYKKIIQLNFADLLAYQMNFWSEVLSSFIWGSFHFILIIILTSKTSSVYNWSRDELILLTATFSILWGFFHILFTRNFSKLATIIDLGELDSYLIKPIDSQFLLSLNYINFTGIVRVLLGILVSILIISKNHIHISLINLFGYIVLLFFGLTLIYSIWFIVTSFMIWFTKLSNLIDFLYNISGISKYPPSMLKETKSFIFFILFPITIFISTPTKVLLNKVLTGDVILLIILSIVFLVISNLFWKFALRSYTSTGN